MSAAKLSKRSIITFSFIVALVVQAGLSFIPDQEPYPAIRMPSFGSAPNKAGMFPTVIATADITYSDGTTLSPHVTELFQDFRFSSARYSFDYMFKPGGGGNPDEETISWLRRENSEVAGHRSRSLSAGKRPTWTSGPQHTRTLVPAKQGSLSCEESSGPNFGLHR